MNNNKSRVIGVMSGTSLDGLDLAYCEFQFVRDAWEFKLGPAETIAYNDTWKVRLSHLHEQPIHLYPKTDLFYGRFIGQEVKQFIDRHALQVDLIASHGHTIFHQPAEGFTAQIGNGAAIHVETGLPVIADFRTVDVMLGGQGAPLVPIGDALLFNKYDACLNLGGFANISYSSGNKRKAFDIVPCNIILNALANQAGMEYDAGGAIAGTGKINTTLLNQLNQLPFYRQHGARSLGREWVEEAFWPLIKAATLNNEDALATLTEHIILQIAACIQISGAKSVLITGGGVYNQFLLEHLKANTTALCVVPDTSIIDFKEALIFAFLGVLKIQHQPNVWCEYTGASRNSIGGALFGF
ncbi:MAG: anhydro-N-acetylmuramic acid kinase [Bacteroidia bacterium]|jgi:anhydro-N-acetylmuramic acid kinase